MDAFEWLTLQNGSDIRGVALEGMPGEPVNLTSERARAIGAAFADWLSKDVGKPLDELRIALGHDSRLSAGDMSTGMLQGLDAAGAETAYFGLASTPALFMSCITDGYAYDGAVMVTASHLPYNRNGFKFFTAAGGLEKGDITDILSRARQAHPVEARDGWVLPELTDFMQLYADQLADKIRAGVDDPDHPDKPLTGLHLIVDAGNGAGGFFVDRILKPLGADTAGSQFLEPDGSFPNHIPNPEDQAAMDSLRSAVLREHADLGIIFDTDVDRAGAVDSAGREINRNRLIALMAAILLEEYPGTTIVTDSVTSDELTAFIEARGGIHHRFKRGYRNVINEAVRLNEAGQDAQLAMETSGHGAMMENYFLDDGAYTVTRILIRLARLRREGKDINDLLDGLEEPLEAGEFRLRINVKDFASLGQEVLGQLPAAVATVPGWSVVPENYEGVRVAVAPGFGDGWFLLRLSLHDPILPLNVEARESGGLKRMIRQLDTFLSQWPVIDRSSLDSR